MNLWDIVLRKCWVLLEILTTAPKRQGCLLAVPACICVRGFFILGADPFKESRQIRCLRCCCLQLVLGMESKLYKKEKSSSILKSFSFSSAKGCYKYLKCRRACSSYYIQMDLKFSVSQWCAHFWCFSLNSFYCFSNSVFFSPTYIELLICHFYGQKLYFLGVYLLWPNSTTFLFFSRNLY